MAASQPIRSGRRDGRAVGMPHPGRNSDCRRSRAEPVGSQGGTEPGRPAGWFGEQYFVGRFDGTTFTNENPPSTTLWTDYGKRLLLRVAFQRGAGPPAGNAGLDEQLAIRRQLADPAVARPNDDPATAAAREGRRRMRLARANRPEGAAPGRFAWRGNDGAALNRALAGKAPHGTSWELRATVLPGAAREVTVKMLAADCNYTLVGYSTESGEFFVDRTALRRYRLPPRFPNADGSEVATRGCRAGFHHTGRPFDGGGLRPRWNGRDHEPGVPASRRARHRVLLGRCQALGPPRGALGSGFCLAVTRAARRPITTASTI